MKKFFLLLLLTGCASLPQNDPESVMHTHVLLPPALRSTSAVQSLLAQPDPPPHKVDWSALAKNTSPEKPLAGLRVALDPGHIGGSPWDERNGKYVVNSAGLRLSEGVMALQLSLLLEKELRALGAEVYLDRRTLQPLTAYDYADFQGNPGVYFQRLDLDVRAEKIQAFRPDLVLILHFDSHLPGNDLNVDHAKELCNDTKAYVPGAFESSDLVDGEDRAFFKVVWSNPQAWKDSVALSREVVTQIHERLTIPFDSEVRPHTLPLEPGVFTRNLRLQRKLAGLITSYVETLCYEDAGQFQALTESTHRLTIDGISYTYSDRLLQLSGAIGAGVTQFVRSKTSTALKPL